jgi:protein involved in polysaccharide export with SLBB domain
VGTHPRGAIRSVPFRYLLLSPVSMFPPSRAAAGLISRLRSTLAALALVASALTPLEAQVTTAQPTGAAQAADLVLRPGDAVKLTVWRAPEFDGEFTVLPNGTLAHPYLRDIVVTGVPIPTVQQELERRAKTQNENAQVIVQPLLRIVVGGEIASPNLYRHPAGTTIAEALVLAGGPTEQANKNHVSLVRDGKTVRLDLTKPNGPATRTAIVSGDQLLLARRRGSIRDWALPLITVVGTAVTIVNFIAIRAQQ